MQHDFSKTEFTIGMLAEQTGVNVPTIRYYEEIGLVPPPKRRPSGHRIYDEQSAQLLIFIRHCRIFGFSIEQVRGLVALSTDDQRDCIEARNIAQIHLDSVRSKLVELQMLEQSLTRFIQSCSDTCVGGVSLQCTIFGDIRSGVSDCLTQSPTCCNKVK